MRWASLLLDFDFGTDDEEIIDFLDLRIQHPNAAARFIFADRLGLDRPVDAVTVADVDPPLAERILRIVVRE